MILRFALFFKVAIAMLAVPSVLITILLKAGLQFHEDKQHERIDTAMKS